jgi:hypothetical protein
MSTRQPPWAAQGQLAATLLPPTRASNSVTARRPPGPGSTAALRGLAGPLHPATCPSIWAGRADAGPTTHRPRWGRALRATPSQPSPTLSTSTTREEDPAGGNRPDATTASPTGEGYGQAEKSLPCLGGEQSKHGCAETRQTPRRRRRTDGARLRRNPNLRRGRLHYSALPVQPRSKLRDPPRLGPAGDDPHEATPPLSCRGPNGQLNTVTSPACAHPPARPRPC